MEKNSNEKEAVDQLRIEGINCKGFGLLPRCVMQNKDLSIWAKLIYAYLVTYTGQGTTAWPGRDLILKDLGICKDTYGTGLEELKRTGFISVKKSRTEDGRYLHNVYTIVSWPENIIIPAGKKKAYEENGILALGWGVIPKVVFKDPRLSSKDKVLYAYLASLADGVTHRCSSEKVNWQWDLGVGKNWINGKFENLARCGYVEKIVIRESGRFAGIDYYLEQNPCMKGEDDRKEGHAIPTNGFQDMDKSKVIKGFPPDNDFPDMDNSDMEISDKVLPNKEKPDNKRTGSKRNCSDNYHPSSKKSLDDDEVNKYLADDMLKNLSWYRTENVELFTRSLRSLLMTGTGRNSIYEFTERDLYNMLNEIGDPVIPQLFQVIVSKFELRGKTAGKIIKVLVS